MQRKTSEPEVLEDLYRLDHLTTRMRRQSEGLIILSGATAGRTWRNPVPILDMVRAAVAEVEDYKRITVLPMPDAKLTGTATADVTHLLAELLENATVFSPPTTMVSVRGESPGGASWWRWRTGGSACRPGSARRSTNGSPARPSSTWPTASSSGCSW
ncbi:hypothetical protein ACFQX6_47225 [Streptosporangium lutulentum]